MNRCALLLQRSGNGANPLVWLKGTLEAEDDLATQVGQHCVANVAEHSLGDCWYRDCRLAIFLPACGGRQVKRAHLGVELGPT